MTVCERIAYRFFCAKSMLNSSIAQSTNIVARHCLDYIDLIVPQMTHVSTDVLEPLIALAICLNDINQVTLVISSSYSACKLEPDKTDKLITPTQRNIF
ncbi:hypothetical protein CDAR_229301 [Caerostris darwini]|uniref:Uncharacterized protein n=1 Tax=Caerostris darwini TaxID=1538125 RepID=A0AAV4PZ25_9ARAC|nr:hypothetical protein CDAR_229301 [Caerostris darwini]